MQTSGKRSNLEQQLFALRDEQYAAFTAKLIPNIAADCIIGVRSPELRRIAKINDYQLTLFDSAILPHHWHEENMLHAYIINGIKDFDTAIYQTEQFLPYITNWAVCDSLIPKAFDRQVEKLVKRIILWLDDQHEYTVRFGISMLMHHFLDTRFAPEYLQLVADIKRTEYYIRMMQAWFFATALAKQWDATITHLSPGRLDEWVRRKSIQKAVESYRISHEQKKILRSLR